MESIAFNTLLEFVLGMFYCVKAGKIFAKDEIITLLR